jgi:Mn-dependent DtxR family transcriptional regulator
MTESIELAIIRREALLLALARFRGNFFDSAITVTSLAEELGIHRTILGFVARPLISEGLIILQGEQGSESAVITENGRSEADEIVKRRSSLRAGTKVLFIDTEPEVIERIKEAGYSVFKANMGYRTGERGFSFPPPNEVDLIVCDLRCPACFDSKYWGPGKNNNQNCTVIPYQSVNNKYYMKGDKRYAEHQVIQESQLGAQIPGTFGPKDVNNAIVKGGVPFIIFLNKEWLDRAVSFPNWLDARWAFDRTAATQVTVGDPLSSLIPEIGTEVRLKLAIQHMIRNGPHVGQINLPSKTSVTNIFTNNIGDVFGQDGYPLDSGDHNG